MMALDPVEIREWARANKAAWELLPLVEMNGHVRVQVGFHLELYARIPGSLPPATREAAMPALWDRLREIVEDLATAAAPRGPGWRSSRSTKAGGCGPRPASLPRCCSRRACSMPPTTSSP